MTSIAPQKPLLVLKLKKRMSQYHLHSCSFMNHNFWKISISNNFEIKLPVPLRVSLASEIF
jgi:hypothetical protein